MDKTELYIKMADCPEVQKYRKGQKDFQIGDLIANYLLGKYSKANFQGIVIFEQHDEIRDRQLAVWLPRQDDIQEMMPKNKCKCPCCLTIHLYKFLEKNIEGLFDGNVDSMEQLWLAFYFHEKHSKMWSSKEEKWEEK